MFRDIVLAEDRGEYGLSQGAPACTLLQRLRLGPPFLAFLLWHPRILLLPFARLMLLVPYKRHTSPFHLLLDILEKPLFLCTFELVLLALHVLSGISP